MTTTNRTSITDLFIALNDERRQDHRVSARTERHIDAARAWADTRFNEALAAFRAACTAHTDLLTADGYFVPEYEA